MYLIAPHRENDQQAYKKFRFEAKSVLLSEGSRYNDIFFTVSHFCFVYFFNKRQFEFGSRRGIVAKACDGCQFDHLNELLK